MKSIHDFIIESVGDDIISTKTLDKRKLDTIKKYLTKKNDSGDAGSWIYALEQLIQFDKEITFSIKDMHVKEMSTRDTTTGMKDWYNAYIIRNAKIGRRSYDLMWVAYGYYENWSVLDDRDEFKCYLDQLK